MEDLLVLSTGVVALIISLIALVRTREKEEKDEKYRLLELKTEVNLAVNNLHLLLGELSVVYLLQLEKDSINNNNLQSTDFDRVKSYLQLIEEKRNNINKIMKDIRDHNGTFEEWQDLKITSLLWAKDIESELSKESSILSQRNHTKISL